MAIKYINIDGIDCAGKSTFCNELKDNLIREGYKVKLIHFPRYETEIGQEIKRKLYANELKDIEELYIFDQVAFTKDIDNGVFDEYDIVLMDRYLMSTSVYEGVIHGTKSKEREKILKTQNKFINKDVLMLPTYNIIIAMFQSKHYEIVEERIKSKNNKDSMECMDKLQIANTLYLSMYFQCPYKIEHKDLVLLPVITDKNRNNLIKEVTENIKKI